MILVVLCIFTILLVIIGIVTISLQSSGILNRCAIVIPIHPKHYHYGQLIVNTKPKDVDLYFVFTTEKDRNLFYKMEKVGYKYLVLEKFTDDIDIIKTSKSFVSIKKLYALSVLYTKYDYISCIDAEIVFLRSNGFYDMMHKVVQNKMIFAGEVHGENEKINYISIIDKIDTFFRSRQTRKIIRRFHIIFMVV